MYNELIITPVAFKTSSNAIEYCDSKGTRTQNPWLSQFTLLVGKARQKSVTLPGKAETQATELKYTEPIMRELASNLGSEAVRLTASYVILARIERFTV